MKLIIELVNYLNQTDNSYSLSLLDFNESQINIAITKILMWLRAEYKRYLWTTNGKKNLHKPLELDYSYDWCNDIKKLILNDDRFSKIFAIKDSSLDFNPNLELKEKNKILIYVGKNLKNQIII